MAWLSFLRGEWLLVTGNGEDPLRKWPDRALALHDLANEGWLITRLHEKHRGSARHPGLRPFGYCLKRTVH